MQTYTIQLLTSSRTGGLCDKDFNIRAASKAEAMAKAQAKYPTGHIYYCELAD
jgi:hypothetical protein